MQEEIEALERNGTWSITTLPPMKKALEYKWVFKTKLKSYGSFEWYKPRLVILGNTQVEGEDFTETFALVATLVTICTL